MAYGASLEPTSAMAKAQRAHGNAAEYAALLIGLFLLVGFAYQGRDLGGLRFHPGSQDASGRVDRPFFTILHHARVGIHIGEGLWV